jgi:hypothetical protein
MSSNEESSTQPPAPEPGSAAEAVIAYGRAAMERMVAQERLSSRMTDGDQLSVAYAEEMIRRSTTTAWRFTFGVFGSGVTGVVLNSLVDAVAERNPSSEVASPTVGTVLDVVTVLALAGNGIMAALRARDILRGADFARSARAEFLAESVAGVRHRDAAGGHPGPTLEDTVMGYVDSGHITLDEVIDREAFREGLQRTPLVAEHIVEEGFGVI